MRWSPRWPSSSLLPACRLRRWDAICCGSRLFAATNEEDWLATDGKAGACRRLQKHMVREWDCMRDLLGMAEGILVCHLTCFARVKEKTHVRKGGPLTAQLIQSVFSAMRGQRCDCQGVDKVFWLTLLQHWPGIVGASLGIWCTRRGR
ncbi:hypothetical protein IWX49DRAFT_216359 [Phyllosticta citricarpa]